MGGSSFKKKVLKTSDRKPIYAPGANLKRGENEQAFLPPELFANVGAQELDDLEQQLKLGSAWDIAIRYHEFKAKPGFNRSIQRIRTIAVDEVLARARTVLGSVVHAVDRVRAPLAEIPQGAVNIEFDVDQTIEEAPLAAAGRAGVGAQDLWVEYALPRQQAVVLALDTSLSMTGEKLALTAVALAVVLLQFPLDPIGVVVFENEASVIKDARARLDVREVIERFMDVPAQGYTHLEDGLREALKMIGAMRSLGGGKPPSGVVLTDGKYTAGRDPAYLAPRFEHLVVLKMGKERGSEELCRELARKGHGAVREVGELEVLPAVMYGVVKDLLRGKSLA